MFDFDRIWDRTQIDNNKWRACTNGEIPMWVADMDFAAPAPILDALKAANAETLRISLNTPISPCIIQPEEGDDQDQFLYMVLPVRLKAGQ